jgi:hypothetical protein
MNKRLVMLSASALLLILAMIVMPAAAQDPGPVTGALATLAAATAQAEQVRAAQRATAAAVSSEATRQAAIAQATVKALSAEATRQAQSVQATAQAQNAQATQSAIDELTRQRAMTATAQTMNMEATRAARLGEAREYALAIEATETAQVMNAQATATSQAMMIAVQATDTARLSATYATRQDRFTWGLLLVEILFLFGAAWVLWKLSGTLAAWAVKMRPSAVAKRPLSGLSAETARCSNVPSAGSVVIDQRQAQEPEPRMPETVQVVDDPRIVEALDRWAERFDANTAEDPGGTHAE